MTYPPEQGLEELRAFVVVVQAGGFVAAARAFQARAPSISFSRRVHDLEARLGVPLVERTTRALRLTAEGQAYYEHAVRALAAVDDAEAVVLGAHAAPRGLLRLTTSSAIATFVLDVVVPKYLADNAGVRVDVDVSDVRNDLVGAGHDLAVWTGAKATASAVRGKRRGESASALLTRQLGVQACGYYASPGYLSTRVVPRSVEGLAAHDTIAVAHGAAPYEWAVVVDGVRDTITLRPRLIVSDRQRAVHAASLGMGIVRAPSSLASSYVARGELVAVMQELTPPGLDVFVVVPARGLLLPRTRVFIELLDACCASSMSGKSD